MPATDDKDDAGELYIVPAARAEACLSKETLLAVEQKAQDRARRLGKRARKAIERELDSAIYYQMKKLEHKAHFLREFWSSFDLDKRDMELTREELLAERVALSVIRSGETKGTQAEKVLVGNDLTSMASVIRQLV